MGVAFAALPTTSALASTIGQTGSPGGSVPYCINEIGAVVVDTSYVVPTGGGTITSFSFQSTAANAGEGIDFLVLRPSASATPGATDYTVVGSTGQTTLQGTGLETFAPAAPIAVQGGDVLGIYVPGAVANCLQNGTGNVAYAYSFGDPGVGTTMTSYSGPNTGIDLNESATFASSGPTSASQCKKGGWQSYGTLFKNQGDCVSFIATGGKNPPSGA